MVSNEVLVSRLWRQKQICITKSACVGSLNIHLSTKHIYIKYMSGNSKDNTEKRIQKGEREKRR